MAGQTSTPASHSHKYTNRLAAEQSPHLLHHAHNPVDWYPWGKEAFAKAKTREMPIFLSIGLSSCHWCHLMDVECFEDEEIAKLLNDGFVNIMVDREERPDIEKVYMTYVHDYCGGGAWPVSVFLSPDLKPFMGGTYFPPDGNQGFKSVIRRVNDYWDRRRDTLLNTGAFTFKEMEDALSASASPCKLSAGVPQNAMRLCAKLLSGSYDSKYGGFWSTHKFPRPVEIQLMLYWSKNLEKTGQLQEAKEALNMALFTLQCMAKGGIHDHIGGGFHRCSMDNFWHIPSFEKMLYDQGQLANVYLDAFSITKDPFYSCVSRDILDYLRRDMIGPEGEFFSAEDADSAEYEGATQKKQGAFYIWTNKEVKVEDALLFKNHYYIMPWGNYNLLSGMTDPPPEFTGKNVLIEIENPAEMASKYGMAVEKYLDILGECRQKLFEIRSSRPRPNLDDKVIVSWNGLAISSFARASKILKGEVEGTKFNFPVVGCDANEYMEVAEKAASFIKRQLYNEETHMLKHSFRNGPSKVSGFLYDYAFLISALLDLYEFGGGTKWLLWAIELQDTQDELFLDRKGGGYFSTAGEDLFLLFRMKDDCDGAEPSGNSVSAINLVRMASLFSGSKFDGYRQNAEKLLAFFETKLMKDSGMAPVPLMCCAAHMLTFASRKQVVLVGHKLSVEFENMLVALHESYEPNKTVIHIDPSNKEEMEFWEGNNSKIALLAKKNFVADKLVALVCQNFTCCSPVVADPGSLKTLLSQKSSSPRRKKK